MSIKSFFKNYLFGWLLPTHTISGEMVQFHKESSIKEDMAVLYVSVRAPKAVVNRIELLMKRDIYTTLSEEAVADTEVPVLASESAQQHLRVAR